MDFWLGLVFLVIHGYCCQYGNFWKPDISTSIYYSFMLSVYRMLNVVGADHSGSEMGGFGNLNRRTLQHFVASSTCSF